MIADVMIQAMADLYGYPKSSMKPMLTAALQAVADQEAIIEITSTHTAPRLERRHTREAVAARTLLALFAKEEAQ